MRNGEAGSAVRILPADGVALEQPAVPGEPRPRRWLVPLVAIAGVVGLFVLMTRPTPQQPAATTPPPSRMADVEAGLVDLRTSAEVPLTEEWNSGFEWNGRINDVLRASSSFVAVGDTDQGAQVWLSGSGTSWRLLPRLDRPETPKSSVDHAVYRNGLIVALGSVDDGIGLWTANAMTAWVYEGRVDVMGSNWISDLVSGPELLAVSATPEGTLGWASANGVDWRELGVLDALDAYELRGFAATEDHYYAFGEDCGTTGCAPIILRSADGLDWGESSGGLPATAGIIDLAVGHDALFAVGVEYGDADTTRVWESRNGSEWRLTGSIPEQLLADAMEIEVAAVGLEPNPWAQTVVAGSPFDIAIGTTLQTDSGPIDVTDVAADSVELTGSNGSSTRVAAGDRALFVARFVPHEIAVEGPRLLVTGHMFGPLVQAATTLLSIDGGTTWVAQHFPEIHGDPSAITAGSHIVVYGPGDGAPAVMHNRWDTQAAGRAAEELIGDYVNALAAYDTEWLMTVLPTLGEAPTPPQLAIPTLGEFEPSWWDAATGDLIRAEVVDTMDYLAGTDARIRLQGCVSVVTLGVADRVAVSCDYTADSALLSLFGMESQGGKLLAVVRNGRISEISLQNGPSLPLWNVLSSYVAGPLHLDAATALDHIAAAREVIGSVLQPGGSRIVETVLGTMEWTWLDSIDIEGADHLDSVVWSDLGFVAVGYEEGQAVTLPTIWSSQDGRTWTALPAPAQSDGVWELKAFAGGVIGQTWNDRGAAGLVFFDGTEWTELEMEPPAAGMNQDYTRVAVSGDRALAVTTWWGYDNATHQAIIIDSSLRATPVELPAAATDVNNNLTIAGTDDGFLLSASSYFNNPQNLTVWSTRDGADWRLLTETFGLEDAQYIWNLEEHRSQYFVVGETIEMRCSSQDEESNCINLVGLWTSSDAVNWGRVNTASGEPVAARTIGSGPLGLIALGQEDVNTSFPRPVYLSVDGREWTTVGGLTLLDTRAEWWWTSAPAVGVDTVIAAGTSYRSFSSIDSADPFLIIGRLIEN